MVNDDFDHPSPANRLTVMLKFPQQTGAGSLVAVADQLQQVVAELCRIAVGTDPDIAGRQADTPPQQLGLEFGKAGKAGHLMSFLKILN